jgi:hypothetical protein
MSSEVGRGVNYSQWLVKKYNQQGVVVQECPLPHVVVIEIGVSTSFRPSFNYYYTAEKKTRKSNAIKVSDTKV